jgi:hypothetical protein
MQLLATDSPISSDYYTGVEAGRDDDQITDHNVER